ncbi:MAG: galactose-1-phosphate uridylyltransferase [Verrucomicrobiota bacterium]|nr:galactose-1-phosphate uridylyltransferase [Verrucomicrobiota bacterium]
MKKPEMRFDPLRQTWTVFAPDRVRKPDFAPRAKIAEPFFNGEPELASAILHKSGSGVRVLPNRVPAFRVEGDNAIFADGFYDRTDSLGAHEIIIETPDGADLETLSLPNVGEVINAWKTRMLDLSRDSRLRSFFVVKNVGAAAGATVPHSISQLVAMAIVPPALKQKLRVAREFYERKKRSIFADILADEVRAGSRLVYENNGFTVFCPYGSRAPFEQAIYPKRQLADFHGVTDQEIVQLADVLKTALAKLNSALDFPAYQLVLSTAPARNGRRDYWNTIEQDFRWHIEIVPRLFYAQEIELGTGCHINTVWPETAAEHLRKIEL